VKGCRRNDNGASLEIDVVPGKWPYVYLEWLGDGSLTIAVSESTDVGSCREITLSPERARKAAKKIRKHLKR
jgi:hypothetical protein